MMAGQVLVAHRVRVAVPAPQEITTLLVRDLLQQFQEAQLNMEKVEVLLEQVVGVLDPQPPDMAQVETVHTTHQQVQMEQRVLKV